MARKDYIVGSGNVFEDLWHARPAEALAKVEFARKIAALIAERGLTQASAAGFLKTDQSRVSALIRGRFARFRSTASCGSSCCSASTWRLS